MFFKAFVFMVLVVRAIVAIAAILVALVIISPFLLLGFILSICEGPSPPRKSLRQILEEHDDRIEKAGESAAHLSD
jgi:hypothetical protein